MTPVPAPTAALRRTLFTMGVLAVVASPLQAEADFDCVMEAANIVELSPRTPGVIQSIEVEKGQRVTKGEVIARIDSSMESGTLQVLEARVGSTAAIDAQTARVTFSKAQLDRAQALVLREAQSPEKLEALENDYTLATSQLRQAQVDAMALRAETERARVAVENTNIRAPVDGVVTELTLSAGEFATADRHVAVLAQTDPIYVDAYFPVALYDSVHPGTPVRIHPEYPVGSVIVAEIRMVDAMFDSASRTFGVRISLPNADGHIVAGMRCRLEIAPL
jgi:RND family efflux transporter MFP subunit